MDVSAATDWGSLCALVFLLGVKHGFDADHLATIDGLTRYNARHRPGLARYCGTLFSLGHGAIVLVIALAVGVASRAWQVPEWLDGFGTLVSIVFLVALGLVNLRAVVTAAPHEIVQPVGLKGRWLGGLSRASTPWLIALVGALFALSFDTLSQAALFAVIATRFGGAEHALVLGLLFMLGMLVVDGVNGLWISRLIRRADQAALIASRVMGLVVSGVSLLVAALAAARWMVPAVDAWSEGRETAFGAMVVLVVAGSFLFALRLARRSALAAD
ncbi:MAG TPA: nickel transporter [Rhodocyclaceae bacterium]|nr:nickel transporter [Rhodocyclaceae bacterium]